MKLKIEKGIFKKFELKEISNARQPSRSKRRQKSDKNVVSLEL